MFLIRTCKIWMWILLTIWTNVDLSLALVRTQRDTLLQYSIPGAHVVNWSYYPTPRFGNLGSNSNAWNPNPAPPPAITTSKPWAPQASSGPSPSPSITTIRTTSTTTKPMLAHMVSNGNKKDQDDQLVDEFLGWAEKNPDPNRKPLDSNSIATGDGDNGSSEQYYDYEEAQGPSQPSEFAFLNLPQEQNNNNCPPGQRQVHGSCRRVGGIRLKPKPKP